MIQGPEFVCTQITCYIAKEDTHRLLCSVRILHVVSVKIHRNARIICLFNVYAVSTWVPVGIQVPIVRESRSLTRSYFVIIIWAHSLHQSVIYTPNSVVYAPGICGVPFTHFYF